MFPPALSIVLAQPVPSMSAEQDYTTSKTLADFRRFWAPLSPSSMNAPAKFIE
jgi:hypothetical protein